MARPFESFASLNNRALCVAEGDRHFLVERHFLIALMSEQVATIKVDEAWYLKKYPDVKDAVRNGIVESGREHYLRFGYFEHRMPTAIQVNEKWYVEAYADIAKAIRAGVYKTGQLHFELAGFREGRLPFANFRLSG